MVITVQITPNGKVTEMSSVGSRLALNRKGNVYTAERH